MKISFSSKDPARGAASVSEVISNLRDQSDSYEVHDGCGFKGLPPWKPDGIETARVCQACGEILDRPCGRYFPDGHSTDFRTGEYNCLTCGRPEKEHGAK